MAFFVRRIRDSRRVRRCCAALRSPAALRAAVLIGFSGIAWLAGVAAAHADPVANGASEVSAPSRLSPVATPVSDPVAAESEQAALTPVNQLESATRSILAVPAELLNGGREPDANIAPATVDASADAATADTTVSESPDRSAGAPAADGVSTAVHSLLSPLAASVEPATKNLTAVTTGVGGSLRVVSQPITAVTRPVGSTVAHLTGTGVPGLATPILAPLTGFRPVPMPASTGFDAIGGVQFARTHQQVDRDSAESVHRVSGNAVSGDDVPWVPDAMSRHSDPTSSSVPVQSDVHRLTTGLVPNGNSLGGTSSNDSGAGVITSGHTARDPEVSRVAPTTAVVGQLPDHVADPAVAPD